MYYRDAYFPKVTEQKNNCVRARRIDQHPHGLCPATGFVEIVDLTRPMPLGVFGRLADKIIALIDVTVLAFPDTDVCCDEPTDVSESKLVILGNI